MSSCDGCSVRLSGFCKIFTDNAIEEFRSVRSGPRNVSAKAPIGDLGASQSFAILRNGWAVTYLLLRDGRIQASDLLFEGDAGPHVRFFGPAGRSEMYAVTDVEYCTLSVVNFRGLLLRHPATASRFFDMMASATEAREAALLRLGAMDAREATADLLVRLAAKVNKAGHGPRQEMLPLSLKLLGELLGITLVHAGRVLKELEGLAIIERRRSGVRVLNFEKLTELVPRIA